MNSAELIVHKREAGEGRIVEVSVSQLAEAERRVVEARIDWIRCGGHGWNITKPHKEKAAQAVNG